MNKLDMFFKEELDYDEFAETTEEDSSLDFFVSRYHSEADYEFSDDDLKDEDPDSFRPNDVFDTREDEMVEEYRRRINSGYHQEQPVDEAVSLF